MRKVTLKASFLKKLDSRELEAVFAGLQWKTKPLPHQYACLAFASFRDRFACWLDIGGGKTLVALYTLDLWDCRNALVVCPYSVVRTWEEEIRLHTDRKAIALLGTRKERRRLLDYSGDAIYLVNYEGLKVVFGKRVPSGTGHTKWDLDPETLRSFDCVIFDESHHLSGKTLQQRIASKLSRLSKHAILLTGTPITKDLLNFWYQAYVLDSGRTLGRSFYKYRRKYFFRLTIPCKRGSFAKYPLRRGAREKILRRLENVVIRFDREECFDLPEAVYQKRYVPMPSEQRNVVERLRHGLAVEVEDGSTNERNILVRPGVTKLAQVTGGFLYTDDGRAVRFRKNPKIDELLEIFSETEAKVIIYHRFVEEGRIIEEALDKHGIKYRSLRGEIADKNRQIEDFISKPSVRVLVAHPLSGGEGLNLQVASVVVFYSQIYEGATVRKQCEGRVHRLGQKRNVVFVDLLMEDSVDEHIHNLALGKVKTAKAILDWIRGVRPKE